MASNESLENLSKRYEQDMHKFEKKYKKISKLKKTVKNIELRIDTIKSQTHDVVGNLSHNIKDYDEKINKLAFAFNVNENAIEFHSKYYDTKLQMLEHELKNAKSNNEQLTELVNNLLADKNEQFQIIFAMLNDLNEAIGKPAKL